MTRRMIVCGGRSYTLTGKDCSDLRTLVLWGRIDEVLHGDARGADRGAAAAIAKLCTVRAMPADWDTWGRAAGPKRNRDMLTEAMAGCTMTDGDRVLVVAFPGGPGTRHMVTIARAAGCVCLTMHWSLQ